MTDLRLCVRQGCGKMFMPTRKHHIYCSTHCRNYAFYMRLVEREGAKPSIPYATTLPNAPKQLDLDLSPDTNQRDPLAVLDFNEFEEAVRVSKEKERLKGLKNFEPERPFQGDKK